MEEKQRHPVTAIVLTRDVEDRIRRCLESVRWADEILVVDSESRDRTVEICREFTDRIFQRPYPGYARQQNFALDHATHDWVFLVDSEEEVPPELAKEVRATLDAGPGHEGYFLYRDNYFFGRRIRHAGWGTDRVMRLFRKSQGRFAEKNVHPAVEIEGTRGWLKQRIRHEPYPTLEEYMEKFGRYTLWGARDAFEKGRRAGVWEVFFHPVWRFFKMYLIRLGILEGPHGLVLSILAAMSVFVKYARLWEMQHPSAPAKGDRGKTDES
jgi:glycosyltransferase involved in cell wall biosynthesis